MWTEIDWVRKLTSRKFWTAVASFISMLIIARGGSAETAERITALIIAGATVIAYIIGEGLTDAANLHNTQTVLVTEEDQEDEDGDESAQG